MALHLDEPYESDHMHDESGEEFNSDYEPDDADNDNDES